MAMKYRSNQAGCHGGSIRLLRSRSVICHTIIYHLCDSPSLSSHPAPLGGLGSHLEIAHMSPPDQDQAIVEHGGRGPPLGVVKPDRLNGEALLSFQVRRDLVPQQVLVGFLLGGLLLVPDDHLLDGHLLIPGETACVCWG